MIECSLVKTRTMRETGGRAELQIQVSLRSLTAHISADTPSWTGNGLERLREVDMHHLRLTYLAASTILAPLKK